MIRGTREADGPVRWAVVGLGHIAQIAVLPAFRHAKRHAVLAALVSDDPKKRRELTERYRVEHADTYDHFEEVLAASGAEAAYIALPNHLHAEFTERAARVGVHVLVEKPMAVTSEQCERMIRACDRARVKLMVGYRLHFEESNLRAIATVARGELGEPRSIHGQLTLVVRDEDNIRLNARTKGGGPLYDLGIYCINASRYLFRAEPTEVMAFASPKKPGRAAEETVCGLLRFPNDRLATFTCGVASAAVSEFRVTGSKGDLCVENAFDYAEKMTHWLTVGEKTRRRRFPKRDQFAAELVHFSGCVRSGKDPEPSGREGLADVRIIEALHRSIDTDRPVLLAPFAKRRRPTLKKEIRRPAVHRPPKEVNARGPSSES